MNHKAEFEEHPYENITMRINHIDLSDVNYPENSGRYVYIPHLFAAIHALRSVQEPLEELERILTEVSVSK